MTRPGSKHSLDVLFDVIESRRGADPDASYTARLLVSGTATIARKLGEESLETVIEALQGSKKTLTAESADLLYHLLVLWTDRGVDPQDVWDELDHRSGVSGLTEKASRGSPGEGSG